MITSHYMFNPTEMSEVEGKLIINMLHRFFGQEKFEQMLADEGIVNFIVNENTVEDTEEETEVITNEKKETSGPQLLCESLNSHDYDEETDEETEDDDDDEDEEEEEEELRDEDYEDEDELDYDNEEEWVDEKYDYAYDEDGNEIDVHSLDEQSRYNGYVPHDEDDLDGLDDDNKDYELPDIIDENEEAEAVAQVMQIVEEAPVKRKRGRPKGSKNKAKEVEVTSTFIDGTDTNSMETAMRYTGDDVEPKYPIVRPQGSR